MDGAPSSKRVRFKPSVGVSAGRGRGASLVPATTASCSRVASPARGEEEEEEEEALLEGEEVDRQTFLREQRFNFNFRGTIVRMSTAMWARP